MNQITKSTILCLAYILIMISIIGIGIYTIIKTQELITVSLGICVFLIILFILINIESQKIEKYINEEEENQQE